MKTLALIICLAAPIALADEPAPANVNGKTVPLKAEEVAAVKARWAESVARDAAELSAKAAIRADVAIVKAAAAPDSTARQKSDGFAAMLRLLQAIRADMKE